MSLCKDILTVINSYGIDMSNDFRNIFNQSKILKKKGYSITINSTDEIPYNHDVICYIAHKIKGKYKPYTTSQYWLYKESANYNGFYKRSLYMQDEHQYIIFHKKNK